MTVRGARAFEGAGGLARALCADAPGRSLLAVVLLLVAAVTETFGIALLIPLLYAAGLAGAPNGGASPVRDALARGAEALGVDLTLPVLLGAFVLLAALRSGVAWQREVQIAALRLGFVDRLRERLYQAIATAAWPVLVRRRSSDLLHVLTHDVSRAGQGAVHLIQASVNVTFALAQGALAVAIAPPIALGMLLGGGVLVVAAGPLVRRSRTLGDRLTAGGRAAHAAMTEFLSGLKLAKSDATEARHVRDFTGALRDMRRQQLDFTRTSAAARAIFNVGAAAALAVLVGMTARQAGLNAPELLVMAFIAVRVLPALLRLQQDAQQFAHVLPAWLHARTIEDSLRDAAEPPADPEAPLLPLRRELTVRGVTFSYQNPPISDVQALAGQALAGQALAGQALAGQALAGVDLAIPAHRLVAVTGPSGAGKTTLLDLLLGLIEPDAGEIRVDGALLAGEVRRRWRGSVAYLPQDPHLFHETLRTNLLRARPGATEAELWRALRQAAAADFVTALPEGLETVVGDRGARLSGGERQRIMLARALLREPALLLLDEATSQLDADTERQILVTLRSLRARTTVVAVTHRPSVLEAADQVVRLEAGRVTAAGTSREPASRAAAAETRPAETRPAKTRPAETRPAETRPAETRPVKTRPVGIGTATNRPWLPRLLSMLLLVGGSTALAQAPAGEDFRSQATARVGPLWLKPSFRLDRLGVETNVFGEPEPKQDFVVSGAPRLDAWLPFQRRAYVTTTLIAGADWYAEYAGERAFNPEIRSRIVLPWRRITLAAGGAYLRTRRRPDFEIDVRSNRFAKDLHGSVAVQVLSRLWFDLEGRQRSVGFDADAFFDGTYLSETLNRKERSAIASLRWRHSALTTFVVASEVRAVRFLRSPDRNSDNVVVTVGADFHPRALISGSGRIGVRRFEARGAAVADISSVVAEADLSYRIAGHTTVTFGAERDINYSFERASPYFVVDRYGLVMTRRLGRQFDLSGRFTRAVYDYQTARRGRDVRWNMGGEFGYRLNPRIRTGFAAGYVRSTSAARARRRYRGIVLGLVLHYDI